MIPLIEKWDIYDINRNKTGKTSLRGEPLLKGEYHLVVFAIIKTGDNEFLISKRSPEKTNPLTWEFNGGSAVSGDDSYQAIVREIKEETGVEIISKGEVISTYTFEDFASCIVDVWYFEQVVDLNDTVCQKGEVSEIKKANSETILKMYNQGIFMPNAKKIMAAFKKLITE